MPTVQPSSVESFHRIARRSALIVGSPASFVVAVLLVLLWLLMGPMFQFSNSWQLIINTTTTIITFLMVVLIQNTQNRDTQAVHLKLDELIRGVKGARNALIDLENSSDQELDQLRQSFMKLAKQKER